MAALGVTLSVGAISSALAWSSLLSYEDVFSVVHSGALVQFGATPIPKVVGFLDNLRTMPACQCLRVLLFGTGALQTVVGARTVVAVWLAGTTALGAGAYSVTRAMCRDFDLEVGRPTRLRADALRSRLSIPRTRRKVHRCSSPSSNIRHVAAVFSLPHDTPRPRACRTPHRIGRA